MLRNYLLKNGLKGEQKKLLMQSFNHSFNINNRIQTVHDSCEGDQKIDISYGDVSQNPKRTNGMNYLNHQNILPSKFSQQPSEIMQPQAQSYASTSQPFQKQAQLKPILVPSSSP